MATIPDEKQPDRDFHCPDVESIASTRQHNDSTIAGSELVDWNLNDPDNPRNWSSSYKYWVTFQLGMLALAASIGSSITAPAGKEIAKYTNISSEVSVLSISLYILGFAFGPLCWAPVSEIWGRRWGMLPAMCCLGVFSIGTAVSKTSASIFVTRFFAGVFGSAPVSNVSAALGDIWVPQARGNAVVLYSIAVVGGPTLGPVIGAALVANSRLGWRWTEYIEAIWAFTIFAVCLVALPESYAPVLLGRRAQRLRIEAGRGYYHPYEQTTLDIRTVITKHFARPLLMLTTEPMVACIACYASFVYGILYLTLEVFPICFVDLRGMSPVAGSLPFLGLFVGVLAASVLNCANQPRHRRISEAAGGKPVPEARLLPVAIAGFIFAIALFWFGWTSNPKFSIWIPIFAAGVIGLGFNVIFNQCINVLVDTYGLYAASAVSANTFLRSIMAAGFPLLAKPMFHGLGVGPAMSILGGIATLMIIVPFLFMKYGLALRQRSKFAPL
ncbi:hypothetical protein V496_05906 [Pseudogymnoascus sp. VKM F-4515 (FW-2607)]|nr:hypothetical protein V496_05906 [Pseudogymnoascus sp. VKM F-4515 (FW-2607)]